MNTRTYIMKKVCCVCHKVYGEVETKTQPTGVSHGYCDDDLHLLLDQIEKRRNTKCQKKLHI